MRCHICKSAPRELACQPFGPDEKIVFMALGHHYRGFPVFGICRRCEGRIQSGEVVKVTYRGLAYAIQQPDQDRRKGQSATHG